MKTCVEWAYLCIIMLHSAPSDDTTHLNSSNLLILPTMMSDSSNCMLDMACFNLPECSPRLITTRLEDFQTNIWLNEVLLSPFVLQFSQHYSSWDAWRVLLQQLVNLQFNPFFRRWYRSLIRKMGWQVFYNRWYQWCDHDIDRWLVFGVIIFVQSVYHQIL